jgi:hypothetical protein
VSLTEAPVAAKKDSKVESLRKQFEAAWWASGAEEKNGMPYLTRSALRAKLIADGCTEATADKKLKPGSADQMIGALLIAEIISPSGNGWVVSNDVQASAMMMARGSR